MKIARLILQHQRDLHQPGALRFFVFARFTNLAGRKKNVKLYRKN